MGCNCSNGCGGSFTLPSANTGETGAAGMPGADGVSIVNATASGGTFGGTTYAAGDLVLTLSNGNIVFAGNVLGPAGSTGPAGASSSGATKYTIQWNAESVQYNTLNGWSKVVDMSSTSLDTSTVISGGDQDPTTSNTDFVCDFYFRQTGISSSWEKLSTHTCTEYSAWNQEHGWGYKLIAADSTGDISIQLATPDASGSRISSTVVYDFKLVIIG